MAGLVVSDQATASTSAAGLDLQGTCVCVASFPGHSHVFKIGETGDEAIYVCMCIAEEIFICWGDETIS